MFKHVFLFIFLSIGIVFTSNSQYCISVGPSSADDSNVESVSLSGESGSSIQYTGCPGVIGLEDLTSSTVYLNAGGNYSIDIQFGTCGGDYAGAGEVWIDYNNDQLFDVTESLGSWSGTPPTALSTFNFQVPVNAQNSTTRLRVMQRESGNIPLNPCDNYSWGSMIDFTIIIQNGIDCSGYDGNYPETAIEINSLPFSDTKSTSYCYSSASAVYNSADIFYKLKVNPLSTSIKASLCGSNFDTHISVQDTGLNALFYNDDSDSCAPQSEILFLTEGLDSIYFVVEGYGNDTGTFILNIEEFVLDQPTGLVKKKTWPGSKIYPNPAKSKFSILGVENAIVNVFDLNGKLLLVEKHNLNNIDVTRLQKGIYLVQIIEGNNVGFKELIIN